MKNEIALLGDSAKKKIDESESLENLEKIEKSLFHKKKGEISQLFKGLATVSADERSSLGQELNKVKSELKDSIEKKRGKLGYRRRTGVQDSIDVTLPSDFFGPFAHQHGHLHPITQTIREIANVFERLGFVRRRYREVDSLYYTFEGLNIPKDHPARNEMETFFIDGGFVLTPHTSNGQLREMELGDLPIRMINISRCARRQEDISHSPSFYQFEGLLIDKSTSIAELKGVISYFAKNYFGKDRKIRLRPNNFRFTEPSFEIDVTCDVCKGKGCRTCKEGWLELGGAGMVHPYVLAKGKINPNKYKGFAFGWGVERVFMMRNAIPDIRVLYQNDSRFLEQF